MIGIKEKTMSDDFVSIDGFPKYGVNREGRVMNLKTGYILRPHESAGGNVYVSLYNENGTLCVRALGLLVARTFIPQPYEHFNAVMHIDGHNWNNSVDNLAWSPLWLVYQHAKEDAYPRLLKIQENIIRDR
jgi:hypothetical protein